MSGSRIPLLLSDMTRRYPKMRAEYLFPVLELDQLFQASYAHQTGATCERCDSAQTVSRSLQPDHERHVHYGIIGSANTVVKDPRIRDMLKKDIKVMCVEVGAAVLMHNFPFLVIRRICDYADSHMNERWQPYASAVAAASIKELLAIVPAQQVLQTARSAEVNLPIHDSRHPFGDRIMSGSARIMLGTCIIIIKAHPRFTKRWMQYIVDTMIAIFVQLMLKTLKLQLSLKGNSSSQLVLLNTSTYKSGLRELVRGLQKQHNIAPGCRQHNHRSYG